MESLDSWSEWSERAAERRAHKSQSQYNTNGNACHAVENLPMYPGSLIYRPVQASQSVFPESFLLSFYFFSFPLDLAKVVDDRQTAQNCWLVFSFHLDFESSTLFYHFAVWISGCQEGKRIPGRRKELDQIPMQHSQISYGN